MPEEILKKVGWSEEEKRKAAGEAYDSAMKLAQRVFQTFPGLIKSIVLFGSAAKQTMKPGSDIDILIVFDDTTLMPTRKFIDWYNTEIIKMIQEIDPRLHVNTVTLTTFWENVKAGEPVAINVLRYGIPLIDTGFFEPLQQLLYRGRIRPTREAIYNCLTRVPGHFTRMRSRLLAALIDLYWVMLDSAHAALMAYGKVPPSPEHVYDMLVETFVKKKLISPKLASYYKEIWETAKAIVHGELIRVNGIDIDNYCEIAEIFSGKMKELVKKKEKELT